MILQNSLQCEKPKISKGTLQTVLSQKASKAFEGGYVPVAESTVEFATEKAQNFVYSIVKIPNYMPVRSKSTEEMMVQGQKIDPNFLFGEKNSQFNILTSDKFVARMSLFPSAKNQVTLICTDFRSHNEHLTLSDFEDIWAIKSQLECDGVKYLLSFNCSQNSGEKIDHIFAYLVPCDENYDHLPINKYVQEPKIKIFDFHHTVVKTSLQSAADAFDAYSKALAGSFDYLLGQDNGLFAYNLLQTEEWTMIVPRRKATVRIGTGSIPLLVDGIAFAGIIKVGSDEEANEIKTKGLSSILRETSYF